MKYFGINTREFIKTNNEGYYYAALFCVSDYIDDDLEPEINYRLDLLLYIDDLCDRIERKPNKELVKEWFNACYTVSVGRV